jgi:putative hemolysin
MEILILFGLILLNGLFSMSEIALVSARKARLESAASAGSSKAASALALAKSPNTFLSTVQIGITIIGIITGIYSGENITDDFEPYVAQITILKPYSQQIAVSVVVVIVTFFTLVLGELVPKRLGMSRPEAIATAVAKPMYIISVICKPFIWLLTLSTEMLLRLFGSNVATQQHMTEEEIKSIIQESVLTGEVQEIEQDIVERAFGLGDLRVSSLMTHRSDLISIDLADEIPAIKAEVTRELHSFYPVITGETEQIEGVLALKDLFLLNNHWQIDKLRSLLRKPHYFPENLTVYKALDLFRRDKIHYALVIDEYGALQGMVTINDILEALVGDISEDDADEYEIVKTAENEWLVDGQYPFFEFINYFEVDGPIEKELAFNTVAGLMLEALERFPETGEAITWHFLRLEVAEMSAMRIEKIKVIKLKEPIG